MPHRSSPGCCSRVAKREERPWKLVDPHFRKHLPRVFTGESTTRRYSTGLLDFMVRWALFGTDPAPLAVR